MEDRFAAGRGLTAASQARRRVLGSSLAAAFAALSLALGLSACGGSGKRPTGVASEGATTVATTAVKASSGSGPSESSGAPASKESTSAPSSGSGSRPSGAGSSFAGYTMPAGDQDGDSSDTSAFDKDDSFVTSFGHSAGAADSKAIESLVTRYYGAIAKADGATACKLLFFVITESAAETYGQTAFDAAAGRGKSCGPVMSKVFAKNRQQLVAESHLLKVMAIRVERKRAWVLLRFGPLSIRRMVVYREGSSWKIGELLDTELV